MSRTVAQSVLLVLLVHTHAARGAALPARVDSALHARDTVAESLFASADRAASERDFVGAKRLYSEVLRRHPGFPPALYRRGMVTLFMGDRDGALIELREAVRADSSAEYLTGLAIALLEQDPVPREAAIEARAALERSRRLDPEDALAAAAAFQAGLALADHDLVRRASADYVRLEPSSPKAWWAIHLARLFDGDARGARAALQRARALGLPEEQYRAYSEDLAQLEARARHHSWLVAGTVIVAGWIVGMLLLLVVGSVLSHATLAAAERAPEGANAQVSGADARLRGLYRGVLWVCCLYYYVSIPVVLALVVGLGGWLIYGAFVIGHIPVKLVLLVGFGVVLTVVAVVRSLFARGSDEDPGLRLDLSQHPRMRAVLDEVAGRVGTRAVDNVYVTHGTEVGVFERGGVLRQMRGATERCLVLGLGVVTGMRMREFKSVLAHEYGHFSNRDTAGGGFALAVRRSLALTAEGLVEADAAGWVNPAWWFVNGFFRLFMRISQGASRLQEVLADRWAAYAYGSESFVRGLTHVIDADARFPARASIAVQEALDDKHPLRDLFGPRTLPAEAAAEVERAVKGAMEAEPTAYDSHPAPAQRIAWVQALAADAPPAADDEEEVWSLFGDREGIERELTRLVRDALVRSQGLMIPPEPSSEAAG